LFILGGSGNTGEKSLVCFYTTPISGLFSRRGMRINPEEFNRIKEEAIELFVRGILK